ncbi:hypothetical protein [Streptomyces sp. A1547]|uniref:hypothetical protein n=1 Tax=Streptomyces sp. A1547 TaxID=2563105 RepID=UPI00144AE792|nr:hypothetical protein [Streptomyces sp. A1547]
MKALQRDPFKEFARTHLGRVLTGRVTKIVPFGGNMAATLSRLRSLAEGVGTLRR